MSTRARGQEPDNAAGAPSCRLFPHELPFAAAVDDLAALSGAETSLRLTARSRGFERLAGHASVRILWCFAVDAGRIDVIASCPRLEALYLEDVRAADLRPLGRLRELRVLSVRHARRIDSLDWLAALAPLTQLGLEFLPRVRGLDPLCCQPQLEALDVSGSIWTRVTVDSFGPIGRLGRLRFLSLTNVVPADGSVVPIGELFGLKRLRLGVFFTWQQLAWLAGRLPQAECPWLAPFVPFEQRRCAACGSAHVMLTGKGQPTICPRCDAERLGRHVERFSTARDAARADADGGGASADRGR